MSDDIVEFATRRFSTDALPEPDRLPTWHDEFGRTLVNVEIDPISDEPFRADATMRIFSDVRTLAVCKLGGALPSHVCDGCHGGRSHRTDCELRRGIVYIRAGRGTFACRG